MTYMSNRKLKLINFLKWWTEISKLADYCFRHPGEDPTTHTSACSWGLFTVYIHDCVQTVAPISELHSYVWSELKIHNNLWWIQIKMKLGEMLTFSCSYWKHTYGAFLAGNLMVNLTRKRGEDSEDIEFGPRMSFNGGNWYVNCNVHL